MTQKTVSTLSAKHIFLSALMIAAVPLLANLTDRLVSQDWIALMFSMNICTSALIVYNWPLIDRHLRRSALAVGDTVLYTVIGFLLTGIWTWFSISFLKADVMIPSRAVLIGIGYARPGMLIAFSFMSACLFNIGFKCITDHMDVRNKEIQAILISALIFGFLMTILFGTYSPMSLIVTYLYYLILTAVLSYLYNQSHSILPGIISVTAVHLIMMILSMF